MWLISSLMRAVCESSWGLSRGETEKAFSVAILKILSSWKDMRRRASDAMGAEVMPRPPPKEELGDGRESWSEVFGTAGTGGTGPETLLILILHDGGLMLATGPPPSSGAAAVVTVVVAAAVVTSSTPFVSPERRLDATELFNDHVVPRSVKNAFSGAFF